MARRAEEAAEAAAQAAPRPRADSWRQVGGQVFRSGLVFAEDFSVLVRAPRRFRKPSAERPGHVLS